MGANTVDLNSDSFKAALEQTSDKPLLVDFWAQWCPPCKALAPILEELGGELKDELSIGKVDLDGNDAIAGAYQVRSIPTLILFKNGQEAHRVVGFKTKEELKKNLLEHLEHQN